MTYLFLFRVFLNTSIKNFNTISLKTFPINLESKPYVNLNKCIDRCFKRHRINISFDECQEMKIFQRRIRAFHKYGDAIHDFKYIYISVEKMEIHYVFIHPVD